jgi:hypothetical protein
MATSGEKRWPQLGRTRWPLTVRGQNVLPRPVSTRPAASAGEGIPRVSTAGPFDVNMRRITAGSRRPSPPARVSFTAVRFDPLLPFERWTEFGVKIARYANGSPWWLGDWLVFGCEK